MRGEDRGSQGFFSYVRLEERIAADHPLRAIRDLIDEALRKLSPSFSRLYAREGRPSIPPERLLRALLLQAFYTVRSERQLMEQLDYTLLFRWFVGLSPDDRVWDPISFSKNRERLMKHSVASVFFGKVVEQGWKVLDESGKQVGHVHEITGDPKKLKNAKAFILEGQETGALRPIIDRMPNGRFT